MFLEITGETISLTVAVPRGYLHSLASGLSLIPLQALDFNVTSNPSDDIRPI